MIDKKIKEFKEIRSTEWLDRFSLEEAREIHRRNIERVKAAVNEYNEKDRPLRILAIHGSSRSVWGGANEVSNSMLFLQHSLKEVNKSDNAEIDEVMLGGLTINPCNNCVASTSGLCGFPCDCWILDDMQEVLYAKLLRSDILFCSTGVNQAAMSSRLKLMCDRMISLDGGYFRTPEEFNWKDGKFKAQQMETALNSQVVYDQRLYGRVAGYFISSKDHNNTRVGSNNFEDPLDKYPYADHIAWSLMDGMRSFGYFHAKPYFAIAASDPEIEYMYDKETLINNKKALSEGKVVVREAINLAKKLKRDLPPFAPDRRNRT